MATPSPGKKKRPVWRIVAISVVLFLSIAGIYLYNDFNRLLSIALLKSFESNIVSNVYEVKFEKLQINLWEGNIRVSDVVFQPRENPLKDYPYINSSMRLVAKRLTLTNVEIRKLLEYNVLHVDRVSIYEPDIQLLVGSTHPVYLPFKDSTGIPNPSGAPKKQAIDSLGLDKFQLIEASIHVTNSEREREFDISNFNMTLDSLFISQRPGEDIIKFQHVDLSVGEFKGKMEREGVRKLKFEDFRISIESLHIQKTLDTLTFQFDDLGAGVKALDLQTRDSLYHLSMKSFALTYKEKSVQLEGISIAPNISDAAMQDRYKYQHTGVSATIGSVKLSQINFDSLIYSYNLFIGEVAVDRLKISIFKDNTKPVDKTRFPKYLGQMVRTVPIPLLISQVMVTHLSLLNVERKRDSSYAKVRLERGIVHVKNITNLTLDQRLDIRATAYIDNKVKFETHLAFDYRQPRFSMEGRLENFSLPELNPLIQAYTPAKMNTGVADEISFSGTVDWTHSNGTLKFLYHELEVDLALQKQAKWKSSVLAFAANSIFRANNPSSRDLPPRVVKFHVERDVNKGFINIIIKSILNGIKETMIMSSENRKTYKEAKREVKRLKK